jgi:hypothetical protein
MPKESNNKSKSGIWWRWNLQSDEIEKVSAK